jgi:hypothetical protein
VLGGYAWKAKKEGGKDCHAGFGSVTVAQTLPGLASGEDVGDI